MTNDYTPLPESLCAALQQEAEQMLAEADFSPVHPDVSTATVDSQPIETVKKTAIHSPDIRKEGFSADEARSAIEALISIARTAVHTQDAREVELNGGKPVVREQAPDSFAIALIDKRPVWVEEVNDWDHDGTTFFFRLVITCRWRKQP